jgi:UDP-2,3-diacylglucosamine pyrophosphatase LpxH
VLDVIEVIMNNKENTTLKTRKLDLVVLSDLHLGTIGCNAKELNHYLYSIQPRILILNGDVLDIWKFRKYYFPESHLEVLRTLLKMMNRGTTIYYLTGNHDEQLRYFSDLHNGRFHLLNKLTLNVDGKRVWVFHGDVFDVTKRYSRWVAKLGGTGYDLMMLMNRVVNRMSLALGGGKLSLSKRIKESVKSSVHFIDDFERTAADLAIENGYDYVICGHIHRPVIREVKNSEGSVIYMNSGDWIEHLTALEYNEGEWVLYRYNEKEMAGRESTSTYSSGQSGYFSVPEELISGYMVDLKTERAR